MNVNLVEASLLIMGLDFYGDPFSMAGEWSEDNAIGQLWQMFGKRLNKEIYKNNENLNRSVYYELHQFDEDFKINGHYALMVGIGLHKLERIPNDFVIKCLEERTYLAMDLYGEDIVSDYFSKASEVLMAYPDYVMDKSYLLQLYDHRFKGMDQLSESMITAWIPLRRV